jgi:hypothetical protein
MVIGDSRDAGIKYLTADGTIKLKFGGVKACAQAPISIVPETGEKTVLQIIL